MPCRSNSSATSESVKARSMRPDLGQVAADPQPVQPQHRIGSGQHHQPQRRRLMVDQSFERLEHAVVGDLVEVVEHQHDRRRQFGQPGAHLERFGGTESGGRDDVAQRTAVRAPHRFPPAHRADPTRTSGDRCRRVQAQPGHPARSDPAGHPGCDGQRLTRARTGTDQCQRPLRRPGSSDSSRRRRRTRPGGTDGGRAFSVKRDCS